MTREEKVNAIESAESIIDSCPKEANSRIFMLVDNYEGDLTVGFGASGEYIDTDAFMQFISTAVNLVARRLSCTVMTPREALACVTKAADSGLTRFADDTCDEA